MIADPVTFAGMMEVAFGEIRTYGKGDARVMTHLMAILGEIAECARTNAQRDALREQATQALEAAALPTGEARARLEEQHRAVMRAINTPPQAKETRGEQE